MNRRKRRLNVDRSLKPDSNAIEEMLSFADKAYDADKRVIEPLEAAGKTAVIPSKRIARAPGHMTKSCMKLVI